MNEYIDRLLDRPRIQKIAILAGLIMALIGAYYSLYYSPQSLRIADLTEQIENARSELYRKRRLTAALPKLKKEYLQQDEKLKKALAQLPDRKEIPDLLSGISSKARESGLEILIFRPRAENPKEFYAEIPVDLVVRGGFHNVVTFFDEVGRLNRLVNIQNIEIRNPKARDGRLTVQTSAQAITYRFLDEAERARIAAARAAKKKSRRR